MGIIALSVAILPLLAVRWYAAKLYKAEVSGQWKDNKIIPKISSTAKKHFVWLYLLLTFLCFISYLLIGVKPFDAVCYTFSTASTGGFAISDTSMTDKPFVMLVVCAIFLFLVATSL